jgi:hypothetical protein
VGSLSQVRNNLNTQARSKLEAPSSSSIVNKVLDKEKEAEVPQVQTSAIENSTDKIEEDDDENQEGNASNTNT